MTRYTRTAIVLHWLIAILILVNVALGWFGEDLPEAWVRPAIDTHKSIGITVLGLALMRLLWRFTHPAPPLPASYPRWEKVGAHLAHALLYVLILAIPVLRLAARLRVEGRRDAPDGMVRARAVAAHRPRDGSRA